ncbi:hypothetical protein [Sodalis praecaptivus]|uniref:hypothetical protein n=1 Tax=Sodalis praecaptivus TaxID=1239307 RepID=UPI00130EFDF5|nr:hypothetical protein [Sodalis praecaptivus]
MNFKMKSSPIVFLIRRFHLLKRRKKMENLQLKRLVADLSLDKAMLPDVLAKRADAGTPARMGQGFTSPIWRHRKTILFCATAQQQLV